MKFSPFLVLHDFEAQNTANKLRFPFHEVLIFVAQTVVVFITMVNHEYFLE